MQRIRLNLEFMNNKNFGTDMPSIVRPVVKTGVLKQLLFLRQVNFNI